MNTPNQARERDFDSPFTVPLDMLSSWQSMDGNEDLEKKIAELLRVFTASQCRQDIDRTEFRDVMHGFASISIHQLLSEWEKQKADWARIPGKEHIELWFALRKLYLEETPERAEYILLCAWEKLRDGVEIPEEEAVDVSDPHCLEQEVHKLLSALDGAICLPTSANKLWQFIDNLAVSSIVDVIAAQEECVRLYKNSPSGELVPSPACECEKAVELWLVVQRLFDKTTHLIDAVVVSRKTYERLAGQRAKQSA